MPRLTDRVGCRLLSFLLLCAAASMWFYVDVILIRHQVTDAAAHNSPRGNLSDLYPRWLGARELLVHGRNPYSRDVTAEIQTGYYGRPINPAAPGDPIDQQAFVYPVYVVFLMAPTVGLPFRVVQSLFLWLLVALSGASVWWWLGVLRWKLSFAGKLICVSLLLCSFPEVQGIKLQQLTLLVAALIAASAALLARRRLLLGGAALALATIKPQLVALVVIALFVWVFSDLKKRWRFVAGFAGMMALLLAASEFVLPGWWLMFGQALHAYREYTRDQSVLGQLAGPWGGTALAVCAVVVTGAVLWRWRVFPEGTEDFARMMALVMALTILIIPRSSPYNQVLLLPSVLWLARERRDFVAGSRLVRVVYGGAVLALAWPWVVSLILTLVWPVSHAAALSAWMAPLYATFGLPPLVFILTSVSPREHAALRAATARGSLEQQ